MTQVAAPRPNSPARKPNYFDRFDDEPPAGNIFDQFDEPAPAPRPQSPTAASGPIIVELPDGREVEFPADTPLDVMERALREFTAGAPTPGPTEIADVLVAPSGGGSRATVLDGPPDAGPADRVPLEDAPTTTAIDLAGNAVEGGNRGLGLLAGALVDAVNNAPRFLNLLPGEQGVGRITENPVGGGRFFTDAMRAAGVLDNFEADTAAERFARRIGEEIGATVLPVGGATLRGARLAERGITPDRMNALDRAFTAPAQRNPAGNAAAEAAIAAGAGTGAQALSEAYLGSDAAELAGALAGSMATAGGMGLVEAGARLGGQFVPGSGNRLVEEAAGKRLVDGASDPRSLSSERIAASEGRAPGPEAPTTAQATGDAGLRSLEARRSRGPNAGDFADRGATQNRALEAELGGLAPNVDDAEARRLLSETEAQVRREFDEARDAALAEARARIASAQEAASSADVSAQEARNAADAGVTRENASTAAAERLIGSGEDSALSRARATRDELYGAVDESVEVRPDRSGQTARRIVDQSGLAGTPPREIQRLAAALDAEDALEAVTFGQAKDDMTVLGDAARQAEREGRAGDARKLRMVRDALREDMAAAPDSSGALSAADAFERDTFAPRFREGAAADVRRGRAPAGRYLDRVFSDPVEADRFLATAEGDEAALKAFRDYALGDLTRLGAENLTSKQVRRWLKRNEEVLGRFPAVRDEVAEIAGQLSKAGKAAGEAKAALKSAEQAQKAAERLTPPNREEAIRLYSDQETAAEGVGAILRSPSSRENLRRVMNLTSASPEAQAGIRRGFVEHFRRKTRGSQADADGAFTIRPTAARNFLEDYRDHVRIVFRDAPEHAQRFEDLVETAGKVNGLAASAPITQQRGRADKLTMGGVPLTSVFSRIFAAESGRTSYRFVLSEGMAQMIIRVRERLAGPAIDNLLDEALLDPKLAAALAAKYSRANERRAIRALDAVVARVGARGGRAALTSQDEGREEK